MARDRSPNREKARVLYIKSLGNMKLIDIAAELGVKDTQIRKWKSIDKWDDELKGTLPNIKSNVTIEKRKRGGQPGNKNAYGENKVKGVKGGDQGKLRALKHGAYANVYLDNLTDADREIYESLTDELNLEAEIKIVKLKIARLLNREESFFYTKLGIKVKKDISDEDREKGILLCMDQLRRLTDTQAKINHDTEHFAFEKYKTEIELQLKKDKLEIEKKKLGGGVKDSAQDNTPYQELTSDELRKLIGDD
jgi:hypothetical protein